MEATWCMMRKKFRNSLWWTETSCMSEWQFEKEHKPKIEEHETGIKLETHDITKKIVMMTLEESIEKRASQQHTHIYISSTPTSTPQYNNNIRTAKLTSEPQEKERDETFTKNKRERTRLGCQKRGGRGWMSSAGACHSHGVPKPWPRSQMQPIVSLHASHCKPFHLAHGQVL